MKVYVLTLEYSNDATIVSVFTTLGNAQMAVKEVEYDPKECYPRIIQFDLTKEFDNVNRKSGPLPVWVFDKSVNKWQAW